MYSDQVGFLGNVGTIGIPQKLEVVTLALLCGQVKSDSFATVSFWLSKQILVYYTQTNMQDDDPRDAQQTLTLSSMLWHPH